MRGGRDGEGVEQVFNDLRPYECLAKSRISRGV